MKGSSLRASKGHSVYYIPTPLYILLEGHNVKFLGNQKVPQAPLAYNFLWFAPWASSITELQTLVGCEISPITQGSFKACCGVVSGMPSSQSTIQFCAVLLAVGSFCICTWPASFCACRCEYEAEGRGCQGD